MLLQDTKKAADLKHVLNDWGYKKIENTCSDLYHQ